MEEIALFSTISVLLTSHESITKKGAKKKGSFFLFFLRTKSLGDGYRSMVHFVRARATAPFHRSPCLPVRPRRVAKSPCHGRSGLRQPNRRGNQCRPGGRPRSESKRPHRAATPATATIVRLLQTTNSIPTLTKTSVRIRPRRAARSRAIGPRSNDQRRDHPHLQKTKRNF